MRDFPLANSNFLAVALYMATTAMVDWNKVLEVCVSNRTTLPYTYSNTLHILTLYACLPLGYNIWNIALYNFCTSLHFKFFTQTSLALALGINQVQ